METGAVKVCPNDLLRLLSLQICGVKCAWTPSTALIMGSQDEEDKIGKSLTVWIKRNHSGNLEQQWRLKRQNKPRDGCYNRQHHETGQMNCGRQQLSQSECHYHETPTKEAAREDESKQENIEPEGSRSKVLGMAELLWPGSVPSQTEHMQ